MPGLSNGIIVYDGDRMYVTAPCIACHKLFSFNPDRVPSIVGTWNGERFTPVQAHQVKPEGAVREPLCYGCVCIANERRKVAGAPLIVILPGAYDPAEI